MRQHGRMVWVGFGTAVLVGFIAVAAVFVLNWSDDSGEPPAAPQVPAALSYECRDEATRAALRAIPRGDRGLEWIGDVGIFLPPSPWGVGHDVMVLGGGASGAMKWPLMVREGVEFHTISMNGAEIRTGEPLSFDYAGSGYAQSPATYKRPKPTGSFGGALRVPNLGVYRVSYALDGIEQGSVVLAFCRTENPYPYR